MASYSARLEVAGQQYPVVLCTYSFTQSTGARGRVNERVRSGLLELVLDVPDGDQLLLWAATPHYPLDGHVSFYQANDLMARETVSFKGGQCVSYQELFEAGAKLVGSYRCSLTIAAPKLELTAGGPPGLAAASPGSSPASLVSNAKKAYNTARQVQAKATQVVQTVAAVQAGAHEAAQLATHGLPSASEAVAGATQLVGLGSAAQTAKNLLFTPAVDKIPDLPSPKGDLPDMDNFVPKL